ncbi:hypothetical protein L2719_03950 [Shewanella schlegeliana]|uniref:Uncharacterized protein n=1 Tax=Shewanella schlegeliana TaxID=190308 RepID=A0ABS1SZZ2_9GAMM|nr:hypothetical protein [Shewanella schlegeliana]MBL4913915.1 hypothetical protein [Shewanella schlegeliana]MCL1108701.1 hypothetical protein [Shewanella schlegeliana]GIU26415.1 hypothetical protein TUM4433_12290 [Shewanella schlegeliana]
MMRGNRQLNIRISEQKIAQLISQGVLCAADFNCLDSETKQAVWQLCLWSCQKRIHCDKQCQQECQKLYQSPCQNQNPSQETVECGISVINQ